jgi:hypothetical protein
LRDGQLYTVANDPPGPASEGAKAQQKPQPGLPMTFQDMLDRLKEKP